MYYNHQKYQPQAINEAEKSIIDFFMSIDENKFNEKARKSFRSCESRIDFLNKKANYKSRKRTGC